MIDRICIRAAGLALAAMLSAGCATHVVMTSDPSPATVYAKACGRSSYHWRAVGSTPMTYNSWYTHEIAFAKWPDGVQSAVQNLPAGCGAEGQTHFVKPVAAGGTNAPAARYDHAALWTGSELMIVAGANASAPLATSAAYDPVTGLWRTLGSTGSPVARSVPGVVWSGTEILLFGGLSGTQPVASLQRLTPLSAWYLYRKL